MPVNWQTYLKNPGDTITAADVSAMFAEIATVLGTGAASNGVQDVDIPVDANIPNALCDNQLVIIRIPFDNTHRPSTVSAPGANRDHFPPTSFKLRFDATLVGYAYSTVTTCDVYIFKNGIDYRTFTAASNTNISTIGSLTEMEFLANDVVTYVTYANPSTITSGVLTEEKAEYPIRLDTYWRMVQ